MNRDFSIIIPARYHSTRLAAKLLLPVGDKSILQLTYEKACLSGASRIIIATDDQRIQSEAERLGAEVCMTSMHHQNGTQRVAEAAEQLQLPPETIIVNVQGDEPLLPPAVIKQVAVNLAKNPAFMMTTLREKITNQDEVTDPSVVKVVTDKQGRALYFSRAIIPHSLSQQASYYRHIGIYAYTAASLKRYVNSEPSPLEVTENLEQLRALWHGDHIHVDLAIEASPNGVNTPQDYELLLASVCG